MAEATEPIALNLSVLGGIVCVDGRAGERIITAKADGTLKAGQIVGVISTVGATLGDIDGIIIDGYETPMGLLLPKYNVDCDTAVADGETVEIVIPHAGHRYNIMIEDPGADIASQVGLVFSSTDGVLEEGDGNVEKIYVCRVSRSVANTSLFAEVIWGPN